MEPSGLYIHIVLQTLDPTHPFQLLEYQMVRVVGQIWYSREICHKHHKQRLCKIISTRVKFYFVSVLLEQFVYVSFGFCGNIEVLR